MTFAARVQTHDGSERQRSHTIQIPRLASRRRDELERLLAIFDQGLVRATDGATRTC